MREAPADEDDFRQRYHALVEAVHMIRRAAERSIRAGVLPAIELHHTLSAPLQECEAVARVLYTAAGRKSGHSGTIELAGLSPHEFRFDTDAMSDLQSA